MGMKRHGPGPGMQYAEHTDRASYILWVPGQNDEGVGGGFHQDAVEDSLVGSQEAVKFPGQREDEVEVRQREEFFSPFLQPPFRLCAVTLWTGSVAARMVGVVLMPAMHAPIQVSTHHFGATIQEILDGTTMAGQHAGCEPIQIVRPMTPEDLGNLGHGYGLGGELRGLPSDQPGPCELR